jgi:hypothetical protein
LLENRRLDRLFKVLPPSYGCWLSYMMNFVPRKSDLKEWS